MIGMLMMAGCSGSGSAGSGSPQSDEAVAAAEAWLVHVDSGDYRRSWDEAAGYFRGAVPADGWAAQVGAARAPLGAVTSRALLSTQPATELPGAPDGEYVIVQFTTSFAHKQNGVETVTAMRDDDGQLRIAGYFIR